MDFRNALQSRDSNFESILEIMKLRKNPEKIDSVRNLLLTTNLILNFFMNREDETLKIPVIYFPICEEYAQELCEDFVTLKLGLFSNKEWTYTIAQSLSGTEFNIPADVKTKRQFNIAWENHKFENKLSEILTRSINEFVDYGKSLIYSENLLKSYKEYSECVYNNRVVNRYWYLRNAISCKRQFLIAPCPLSLIYGDSNEFYNMIVEDGGKHHIENIVIFPTKTADGRYTNFCADSFQKPYLDDFVNSGCGLKNVLFFCFSRKPYRLRRLFDFKQRMKERIQIFDEDSYEFISFTYEESLLLSGKVERPHLTINICKDNNEIQEDYETIFDDMTKGLDRAVSRRNEMSICFDKVLSEKYTPRLIDEIEVDENLLNEIFRINNRLWKSDAETVIRQFVFNSDVFIITGNDIDEELKDSCGDFLKGNYGAKMVSFGTFGDLRGYQINGVYKNEIKCNKIIIMSFRNDYTNSIFHKYPNSFDPYCINDDQQLIEISNYFYLRQYYYWGRYNYGKAIRHILKSEFRKLKMKPFLVNYEKPTKKITEDTREEENDRNVTRTIKKIKVYYLNGSIQEFGKSEWIIYKYCEHIGISTLSDLYDLYESTKDLYIQPLSYLVRQVYNQCVVVGKERDTRSEKVFKEQPLYNLTPEEINSNTQLWKILLSKRVKKLGCRNVFEDIMSNFNERYRVSYHSFKRWMEPEYGIPRARRVQKFLVENYLGIRPPYINLIRRMKERNRTDTEEITINIRHFLNIALLNNNTETVFDALSDEIRDLLDINEPNDIKRIITDVKEIINFEPVKLIEQ